MTYDQVCNKSNRVGATSVAGTAYPPGTPPVFSGVRVVLSLLCSVVVIIVCLFALFLYCPPFFNLQLLITPLVSSNISRLIKGTALPIKL